MKKELILIILAAILFVSACGNQEVIDEESAINSDADVHEEAVNEMPIKEPEIQQNDSKETIAEKSEENIEVESNSTEESSENKETSEKTDTGNNAITGATVTINNGFEPKEVVVKVGQAVTWKNANSNRVSKISSSIGKFFSPRLTPEESFTYVFEKPGKFPYIDAANKLKNGVVVVVEDKQQEKTN